MIRHWAGQRSGFIFRRGETCEMTSPRAGRPTASPASQASQLLQVMGGAQRALVLPDQCGSGLARDGVDAVLQKCWRCRYRRSSSVREPCKPGRISATSCTSTRLMGGFPPSAVLQKQYVKSYKFRRYGPLRSFNAMWPTACNKCERSAVRAAPKTNPSKYRRVRALGVTSLRRNDD